MILLDTDHLSVFEMPDTDRWAQLVARLALTTDEVIGTTVVNLEDNLIGTEV